MRIREEVRVGVGEGEELDMEHATHTVLREGINEGGNSEEEIGRNRGETRRKEER